MKNDDNDLKQQVALFRYGLIADIVCFDPGTREIYRKLKEKAARPYEPREKFIADMCAIAIFAIMSNSGIIDINVIGWFKSRG